MNGETPGLLDTIAAIATAPGRGAVALLRISGPQARTHLSNLCPAFREGLPPPRAQVLGAVSHPETGELVDRALITWFPAPRSFTGEDTVEISGHGGAIAPRVLLAAALASGCRPALPGEFTRRAYLNGKLDLVQAEAVGDLVDGRSPALHRAALHQMERGLSARLATLRDSILRVEALAAYSIDFPEEDEPPVPVREVLAAAEQARSEVERVLSTAPEGELLRVGPLVVFAGLPNSGKSSLFNALLGVERSIVTEVPGTTRDAVEAEITIEGFPFRLADTAGLRTTSDRVESLGIEVARRYLRSADIVLFCTESPGQLASEESRFLDEHREARVLLVQTKVDLEETKDEPRAGRSRAGEKGWRAGIRTSARTGIGLEELRVRLLQTAFGTLTRLDFGEQPVVTRERHAQALRQCVGELEAFTAAVGERVPLDVAATHLRGAAAAIEDVIGVVSTEDVLSAVFSSFCIGK